MKRLKSWRPYLIIAFAPFVLALIAVFVVLINDAFLRRSSRLGPTRIMNDLIVEMAAAKPHGDTGGAGELKSMTLDSSTTRTRSLAWKIFLNNYDRLSPQLQSHADEIAAILDTMLNEMKAYEAAESGMSRTKAVQEISLIRSTLFQFAERTIMIDSGKGRWHWTVADGGELITSLLAFTGRWSSNAMVRLAERTPADKEAWVRANYEIASCLDRWQFYDDNQADWGGHWLDHAQFYNSTARDLVDLQYECLRREGFPGRIAALKLSARHIIGNLPYRILAWEHPVKPMPVATPSDPKSQ